MPLHASSQSFSGLWVAWLNLTSSFRRSITNKMNEVLKNTHTFVEVLKMAKCEAVERWDEAALHRAYKWAQYFEEVSWCRFFGTPLFSASPGLQSHIYIYTWFALAVGKKQKLVSLFSFYQFIPISCTVHYFLYVWYKRARSRLFPSYHVPHITWRNCHIKPQKHKKSPPHR